MSFGAKRFLIATHNQDKATLATALLRRANPAFCPILLDQVDVLEEAAETGSLLDRATQKAITYGVWAQSRAPSKFGYVMGIDDAIVFEGQQFDATDSKRATEVLLAGGVPSGSKVVIRHAMTILAQSNYLSSFIVEIPFEYVGPRERLENVHGTYPLLHVLRIPHQTKPLDQVPYSEYVNYYWNLCASKLIRTLQACDAI